ncbi:MAG: DUF362 domain-containing protein [candidate division KSB1 bacterium]|jgi:uncharacterized protein (DUF362 family)/Pyruvate/2-oxoacid:ferredoxin oxidoreductase delta subunit|nr:DUF362 domain-containing protein [candidate division KSB1 bacterium]
MSTEKSIVAIAECARYHDEDVRTALQKNFKAVGGIERFIRPSDRVFIKPNLLTTKGPESAATTHPSIVRTLAFMVKDIGAKAFIGDSPAGISKPIQQYWKATGMAEVAEQTGARLVPFENKGVIERIVLGRKYYIAKDVAEADIVINVCKMKTHGLTLFTGAVKNMFGVIPGFKKGEYHMIAPKVEDFSEILVDVYQASQPGLNIMDAVIAMEGNGPSSGIPKQVGYIAMSTDGIALDSVMSSIAGFQNDEIHTTRIATERGIGVSLPGNVVVSGVALEEMRQNSFQFPSIRIQQFLPGFLTKLLGHFIWVRPYPNGNRCQKCGLCIRNCPVQAMKSADGFPEIDYSLCIKCFCCDEICPHDAIEQRASWLVEKFM